MAKVALQSVRKVYDDAGVAVAAQTRMHGRLVAGGHGVSDVIGVAVLEQPDVVRGEVGVPEHLAGIRARVVDLAFGAERDGNACHDAYSRSACRLGGFGDSGHDVVADRALVRHPQDGSVRALPGDLAPRDAQDLMAYPFFSLAKTKRVVPIDFRAGAVSIRR